MSQHRNNRPGSRLAWLSAAILCAAIAVADSDAPRHLTSWAGFDAAIADGYEALTNDAVCAPLYPPGLFCFGIHSGYFTFDDSGDLAGATNYFAPSAMLGVPAWRVSVIETQLTERVWIVLGVDGLPFRTNAVPAGFDPQSWVWAGYGEPPGYLTGAELTLWYACRDRSRLSLGLTLIASNDWPTLQAAFAIAATNTPSPETPPPFAPSDSNRVAFAGIEPALTNTNLRLWLYTPTNQPVNVFSRVDLTYVTNGWTLLGSLDATAPFDTWEASAAVLPVNFFHAALAGIDTDGDGLPDGRERLVFGTNPELADSDNDGLSDFDELYHLGTDPLNPDITPPTVTIIAPVGGSWQAVLP